MSQGKERQRLNILRLDNKLIQQYT